MKRLETPILSISGNDRPSREGPSVIPRHRVDPGVTIVLREDRHLGTFGASEIYQKFEPDFTAEAGLRQLMLTDTRQVRIQGDPDAR
jgi:hypothetical protein